MKTKKESVFLFVCLGFFTWVALKRNCTPNQNWACFVCYLKSSTLSETYCKHSATNCLRNSKMALNFSRRSSFWVIDQNNIFNVMSIIQELLGLLKSKYHFLSSSENLLQDKYTTFQNCVDDFEKACKTC